MSRCRAGSVAVTRPDRVGASESGQRALASNRHGRRSGHAVHERDLAGRRQPADRHVHGVAVDEPVGRRERDAERGSGSAARPRRRARRRPRTRRRRRARRDSRSRLDAAHREQVGVGPQGRQSAGCPRCPGSRPAMLAQSLASRVAPSGRTHCATRASRPGKPISRYQANAWASSGAESATTSRAGPRLTGAASVTFARRTSNQQISLARSLAAAIVGERRAHRDALRQRAGGGDLERARRRCTVVGRRGDRRTGRSIPCRGRDPMRRRSPDRRRRGSDSGSPRSSGRWRRRSTATRRSRAAAARCSPPTTATNAARARHPISRRAMLACSPVRRIRDDPRSPPFAPVRTRSRPVRTPNGIGAPHLAQARFPACTSITQFPRRRRSPRARRPRGRAARCSATRPAPSAPAPSDPPSKPLVGPVVYHVVRLACSRFLTDRQAKVEAVTRRQPNDSGVNAALTLASCSQRTRPTTHAPGDAVQSVVPPRILVIVAGELHRPRHGRARDAHCAEPGRDRALLEHVDEVRRAGPDVRVTHRQRPAARRAAARWARHRSAAGRTADHGHRSPRRSTPSTATPITDGVAILYVRDSSPDGAHSTPFQ